MEHLRNIELSCASNWKELLQERRALIEGFDEGLGYDLRASIQALQRIPAIMDYDENRCDEVLSSLTSTIQVPTLRLNTVSIKKPWEEKDWDSSFHKLPYLSKRNGLPESTSYPIKPALPIKSSLNGACF